MRRFIVGFSMPIIAVGIWFSCMLYFDLFSNYIENWPIALAMILGSFIAGSTPVGGGTIGYPVMVLFFSVSSYVGCDFALAIQSVGMGMASYVIIMNRDKVAWNVIGVTFIGGILGFVIGSEISYLIPINFIKITFAVLWIGIILHNIFNKPKQSDVIDTDESKINNYLVLAIGITGGLLASLIGTGIDMLVFVMMTYHFNFGYKIALRTSIVIMTAISIFGIMYRGLFIGFPSKEHMDQLFNLWIVCVPVVAIGAPLGAIVIRNVKEKSLKFLLYAVVICQIIGSYLLIKQSFSLILYQIVLLGFFYIVLSMKSPQIRGLKTKSIIRKKQLNDKLKL